MAPPEPAQRLLDIDPALLEDGEQREQWEAIPDLDHFFARVYAYYRERGLRCILASRIISLLTLSFTIVRSRSVPRDADALTGTGVVVRVITAQMLVIFVVEMLNWHGILYLCQNEVVGSLG